MVIINSIVPIFLMVALGWYLKHIRFLSEAVVAATGKLIFWVATPALLFYKIVAIEFEGGPPGRIFLVLMSAILLTVSIAYLSSWVLRIPSDSRGTFVQGSFRSNTVFVGLSVIFYTFTGEEATDITNLATLAVAPTVPFLNFIAILVLMRHGEKGQRQVVLEFIYKTVSNPLVLACVAALIFSLASIPIPDVFDRTLRALGQIALPLALLLIGASLSFSGVRGSLLPAVWASVLNVIILPLLGYFIAKGLGLSDRETLIALIFLACPTAANSYIMVQQMGGDQELAASTVVFSTLFASVSLSMVLYMFLG